MKNATLWKRILNEGVESDGDHSAKTMLASSIISAPIITCPLFVKNEGDSKLRQVREYSKLAIPFDRFWIEREMSDYLGNSMHHGVHVSVTREKDWDTLMCCEVSCLRNARPKAIVAWQFRISKDGSIFTESRDGSQKMAIVPVFARHRLADPDREIIAVTFDLCDMLSLLSCKNISLASRKIDLTEREERSASRRGSDFRYHVLILRPPGARSDHPGEEIGNMPRHVCRGHFAEYGPDFGKGLLFGKYAGRFYVPPHMKGDKKNGVVEKDYEVRV